jgi:hypothetical protein
MRMLVQMGDGSGSIRGTGGVWKGSITSRFLLRCDSNDSRVDDGDAVAQSYRAH